MEGMGKCDGRTKLETIRLPPSEQMLTCQIASVSLLRLRAKIAQTGNPTHVPRTITGGLRFQPCLLSRVSSLHAPRPHIWVQITQLVQPLFTMLNIKYLRRSHTFMGEQAGLS